MIAANAVVAGSSVLGERVWVGPSATISNGLTVGDDASISLGAVVTRDVAPRARMTGNFAVEHERFLAFLRTMR
jgi:UDP-3-O-[3-hydroxymyristoyl] glucosamine N-acyltransferase